jgi:phage recombination protein Bet
MPAKDLATTDQRAVAFAQTKENIELLKSTLTSAGTNLTDNELRLFLHQSKQTGLDPLAKQIYVMKSGNKLSFMTSIDGQRLVAQRTGQYEGQVGPQWCGKDGQWLDVWLEDEHPAAARVGVYRTNFKEPVYGVATWKSYANENSQTWKKLGDVMLAKCAEALAIRKAFPQELSGIYTSEEMDQAQPEHVDAEVVQAGPELATENQVKRMFAMLRGKGVKDAASAKRVIYNFGEVDSVTKLTYEQASNVINKIDEMEEVKQEEPV